jgi:hypothetical protein
MLGGDELEVNSVHNGPHLPGSLTGGEKVALDFVADCGKGITIDQTKVGEKDSHENGTPENLVNGHLGKDSLGIRTLNLAVEPVVKVVSRRSVVDETKDRKCNETLPVKGAPTNENLKWETKR